MDRERGRMSEYEGILNRLLSAPLRGQIKIDFDTKNKFYVLSVPIFSSHSGMPQSLFSYVDARKTHEFKPHATTFQIQNIGGVDRVCLMQRISFSCFSYPALRLHVDHFWKMARKCRTMLSEIALEEKLEAALNLASDSQDL